jgi:hypothetical protein
MGPALHFLDIPLEKCRWKRFKVHKRAVEK